MNASLGTFRLLYEDARWFIGKLLLLYVTLPLTAAWLLVGISFELKDTYSALYGPAYFFFIPFYGVMGFKSLLHIAVSLGSTRVQLLKSFYIVGLLGVILYMLCLNICQWILWILHDSGISSVSIGHPGTLLSNEFHFLSYLWIDIMIGLVLFGCSFFVYSITYRAGMTRTLIGTMIIGIAFMFLYYSGALTGAVDWASNMNLNAMSGFTLAGAAGAAALLATYPIMRNASLLPKGKRE